MKSRVVVWKFKNKPGWKLFPSEKLLKPMFVDFKFSTIKIQVSDYLTPRENSVFLFTSVSGFLSIQTGLTKLVLLVFCPAQRILPGIGTWCQLKI